MQFHQRIFFFVAITLTMTSFCPPLAAQNTAWDGYVSFRNELEELNREGRLQNPLILLDLACDAADPLCSPVLRMFVKNAATNEYRIPPLPPFLSSKAGRLAADKAILKKEKKGGGVFEETCARLPKPEICEGRWTLKKVWTLKDAPPGESALVTMRTPLLIPGATGAGASPGSRTAEQVLRLKLPVGPLQQRIPILLWELNGALYVPETYAYTD